MGKQIFGYTEPTVQPGNQYVEFAAAIRETNGDVLLSVRDGIGRLNSILLPKSQAEALGKALIQSGETET